MKILITGGSGFIGSALAESLALNHKITTFDLFESPLVQVESIKGSILNKEDILKIEEHFDVVYHLAAQVKIPYSIENPNKDAEINILGTINLLKSLTRFDKVIFASTASVYGYPLHDQVTEVDPIAPITPYGLSKYCAELYVTYFSKNRRIPFIICRFFNIYGYQSQSVIPIFIKKALLDEPIAIFGTGNQKRDFLYIDDAIASYKKVLSDGYGFYNIGSGIATSINDLVNLIISLTNSKSKINYQESREPEEKYPIANISKFRKELNYEPSVSIEEGIKKIIYKMKLNNY